MVPETGRDDTGGDAPVSLHQVGLDDVGGSVTVPEAAGAHAELSEVPELPRELGDKPVPDPVLPGVAAVVGGIGSGARSSDAVAETSSDCNSFPLIAESALAGPPKHKFRFFHVDAARGIEIPYVMWLDERMRVSSLRVDSERPVSPLPGFATRGQQSPVTVTRTSPNGERSVVFIAQKSVEATRLLESTVPLANARQEAIRQRMLAEIDETIEDPGCPSQACTANSIRRKYREQMELTLGGGG